MMSIRIAITKKNETLRFAADELMKYFLRMDPGADIALMYADYNPTRKNVLWLGFGEAFALLLPSVEKPDLDDGICLKVNACCGVVAGCNPRAALIAAYRLLRENGCFFDRPSAEIIPSRKMEEICADVTEVPDSRYRIICIEGADSYRNILDTIAWLPKVGMNGYYRQFFAPHIFFKRWYEHEHNPLLSKEEITEEDSYGFMETLDEEIYKRGLIYHAVGHGWTAMAFGLRCTGWDYTGANVPAEWRHLIAEVNGERKLWNNCAINTNLCYSNPQAQERITDAIVEYAAAHPRVDFLHFWLADDRNNHCECPECRKATPVDYYVRMLNKLDEKLSARGLPTRIVFLLYNELLWTSRTERIQNPDRFLMMFAPITRTYAQSFQTDTVYEGELPVFELNNCHPPKDVAVNVAMLKKWQEQFDGECVDYDYHYTWDHILDVGYYQIARTMLEDVKGLRKLKMDGFISCQMQRTFFPHGLGMHMMAQGLWDKNTDFEEASSAYFENAFGKDGHLVKAYMKKLSYTLHPDYLRGRLPVLDEGLAKQFSETDSIVDEFMPIIQRNLNCGDPCMRKAWSHLIQHGNLAKLQAKTMAAKARGLRQYRDECCDRFLNYIREQELELQPDIDVWLFTGDMETLLRKD